jgi:hypothetical protein
MDFIFDVVLSVLKWVLRIALVTLLIFLAWRWLRDSLPRIRERFAYGLRRIFDSVWRMVSLKWLWQFLRDLVSAISGLLGSIAKRLSIDLKESATEFLTSFRRIVIARRIPAVRRKSKPLFRTSHEEASAAAVQRGKYLRSVVGDAGVLDRREYQELPPGFDEGIRGSDELGWLDALIQTVTLRAQLGNDSYALFGRVVDALIAILRQTGELSLTSAKRFTRGGSLDASLKPLGAREVSEGQFPWVVVVGTNRPELVGEKLFALKDWLGIGIDIARPLNVQPYWACRETADSIGTIAGLLFRISSADSPNLRPIARGAYALTCAHVAPKCNCHVVAQRDKDKDKASRIDGPDALLIPSDSKCLMLDTPEIDVLRPARPSEIDALARPEKAFAGRMWKLVRRKGGESRALPGIILCPLACHTSTYESTGENEFKPVPMAQVVLYRLKYLFGLIPWPMFRRYFSRPGDSGSWVITEDEKSWVGMLTEGDTRANLSYVLRAPELIEYFGMLIKSLDSSWKDQDQCLVPVIIKGRGK